MAGGGGQIQVVQVHGELYLATADSLAARGYAAIGRQARVLLLDVAGVSFCDACGLSALVRIASGFALAGRVRPKSWDARPTRPEVSWLNR